MSTVAIATQNSKTFVVKEQRRNRDFTFGANCTIPKVLSEKEVLKQQVDNVLKTYGEENWDGEGALPILPETAEIAKSVVEHFPIEGSRHLPDVGPTPHGEIDFDWLISKNMMLTVGVNSKGVISYAGILEIVKNQEWDSKLPPDVLAWFAALKEIPADG